jgi:hypothetical protein
VGGLGSLGVTASEKEGGNQKGDRFTLLAPVQDDRQNTSDLQNHQCNSWRKFRYIADYSEERAEKKVAIQ